jgi:hypothetical protein
MEYRPASPPERGHVDTVAQGHPASAADASREPQWALISLMVLNWAHVGCIILFPLVVMSAALLYLGILMAGPLLAGGRSPPSAATWRA